MYSKLLVLRLLFATLKTFRDTLKFLGVAFSPFIWQYLQTVAIIKRYLLIPTKGRLSSQPCFLTPSKGRFSS